MDWLVVTGAALTIFPVLELAKWLVRRPALGESGMMLWLQFAAITAVIVLAGSKLYKYGDVIAEKTGMGRLGLVSYLWRR